MLRAQQIVQAEILKLQAIGGGLYEDENFQKLFKELGGSLVSIASEMCYVANSAEAQITDTTKRNQLHQANSQLQETGKHLGNLIEVISPTASDPECQKLLSNTGKGLETSALFLVATAKNSGVQSGAQVELSGAASRIAQALANLVNATNLPNIPTAEQAEAFNEGAQEILTAATTLMVSEGNAKMMGGGSDALKKGTHKLGVAAKSVVPQQANPQARERAANYVKEIVAGTKTLLSMIPKAQANPQDAQAFKAMSKEAQNLAEVTQQLLGDTGKQVAIGALYNSAKQAAADTSTLSSTAKLISKTDIKDPAIRQAFEEASDNSNQAVAKLISVLQQAAPSLKAATQNSGPSRSTTFSNKSRAQEVGSIVKQLNEEVLKGAEQFAPLAFKMVAVSKQGSASVSDPQAKQNLIFHSTTAAKSIQKMLLNRKAMKSVKGQLETAEAMEEYKAALTELESAIISADTGILAKSSVGRDQALEKLHNEIITLGIQSERVIQAAKSAPEELGTAMKDLSKSVASLVQHGTDLASNVDEKTLQKVILNSVKGTADSVKNLYQFAKATSVNPDDKVVVEALGKSGIAVAEALKKLKEAASGIIPKEVEDAMNKRSNEIEDLAEKELIGAANVIESCVLKLQQATENARRRAQEKDINIDEQNITEAILEAAQAIAKSTGVLVQASTQVQREFNLALKSPKTSQSYHRDPQWAEGLISAAKMVAGSVQHLVKGANEAASGNSSEEALVVSAQAVSSATAQLVTASTVKADPNSTSQMKLREAAGKVGAATRMLVKAAKEAAKWEEEKHSAAINPEEYSLSTSKIQEMEKQMEILRLEKELEKKRTALLQGRKEQYTTPQAAPAAPSRGGLKPSGPVGLKPAPKSNGTLPKGPAPHRGGLKIASLKPQLKTGGTPWETVSQRKQIVSQNQPQNGK